MILLVNSRYIWSKLREWHPGHSRDFPWRSQDICSWGLLLAEMLLRRTDGPTVAKIFPLLYSAYPSPRDMARASREEIMEYIRPLGLWGQRSQALLQLAGHLVDHHSGLVPKDHKRLLALPHVGPYVAGAVMVFAFGRPAPMPDINIIRIMSRFFCMPDKSPGHIRALAGAALINCPRGRARDFYYALLDLGSAHCRARPRCPGCPLERKCLSRRGMPLMPGSHFAEYKVAEEKAKYIY